jgi:acetyl-CoA acetyltransferase
MNVEGGCATGSMALHGAVKDILSGSADLALAIGVEKTYRPDAPAEQMAMFRAGENSFNPEETLREFEHLAKLTGRPLEFGPDRTMFMDTYAAQANYHMHQFGTTQQQLAAVAAKNHTNGAANPLAQYRFPMTVEQVLADREISYPLTRSMCAPIGDGAAAAIVCSDRVLARLPGPVRGRAVRVAATVLRSGIYRRPDEVSLSRVAADRAYQLAGIGPERIDVAEVHDATAFGEIYQAEQLRFCDIGAGGPFVAGAATALDGRIPLNTSGGLLSKGHPIAASGLSMTHEIVTQLRGEAGDRQVRSAAHGLVENGGGIMGLEEAACAVTILARS